MKHIKLFEEISTPINPELLGVMNNAETLTRKAFSILFDKYVRNNDKASIFHLMKLANKYHREWFYDENFLDKIAVTLNNYNMEPEDFDSREWLGTPAEREKMEREYTESKARLEKSLIFNFFIYGSQEGNPKAKSVPQKMGLDRLISYLSGYGVAGGSVSHGVDPSVLKLGVFIAQVPTKNGFNRIVLSSINPILFNCTSYDNNYKKIDEIDDIKSDDLYKYTV